MLSFDGLVLGLTDCVDRLKDRRKFLMGRAR